MGASVPAAGHISDNARTTLEVKNDLEDALEVLRRTLGADSAGEFATISAGNIAPSTPWIGVRTEGAASTDDLNTIDSTEYTTGSIIMLEGYVGETVTLKQGGLGADTLRMADGNDFDINLDRKIWFLFNGNRWQELYRSYGPDIAAQRAYLGLGNAALATTGPGNGLDADTLDGQHASAFLLAAAQAVDSAALGGVAASAYVRNNVAALQSLAHNLQVGQGRFIANHSAGQSSGLEMHIGGSMLARLAVDDQASDVLTLELFDSPGGAIHRAIRLTNGGDLEFYDGSTWHLVFHEGSTMGAGSGLDADLVHGEDGGSIFGDGGVAELSWDGNLNAGVTHFENITTKFASVPRGWGDFGAVTVGFQASSETQVLVFITNNLGTNQNCHLRCRYIAGDPPLNS